MYAYSACNHGNGKPEIHFMMDRFVFSETQTTKDVSILTVKMLVNTTGYDRNRKHHCVINYNKTKPM